VTSCIWRVTGEVSVLPSCSNCTAPELERTVATAKAGGWACVAAGMARHASRSQEIGLGIHFMLRQYARVYLGVPYEIHRGGTLGDVVAIN
jgi:hypothetical protein